MTFGLDLDHEDDYTEESDRTESAMTVRVSLSLRRTLHRLPEDPVGLRREALLCGLVADGKPLGDHHLRWRSADEGDGYFEKRFCELMDLARVLAGSGLHARIDAIESTAEPLPDFRLRLKGGGTAYAEVGRILVPAAAALSNGASALLRAVRRRERGDRRLRQSLRGITVTLTLAQALGGRVVQAADETEDLLRWIAGDADDGDRSIDAARFPVLHSLGAACDVIKHGLKIYSLDVIAAAPPRDPVSTTAAFDRLRAQKARKRNGYPVTDPVWLVMPLADEFQTTQTVLDALRSDIMAADPRPYDVLAIGTIDEAIAIEAPSR